MGDWRRTRRSFHAKPPTRNGPKPLDPSRRVVAVNGHGRASSPSAGAVERLLARALLSAKWPPRQKSALGPDTERLDLGVAIEESQFALAFGRSLFSEDEGLALTALMS